LSRDLEGFLWMLALFAVFFGVPMLMDHLWPIKDRDKKG
jgi:hypothetical protein